MYRQIVDWMNVEYLAIRHVNFEDYYSLSCSLAVFRSQYISLYLSPLSVHLHFSLSNVCSIYFSNNCVFVKSFVQRQIGIRFVSQMLLSLDSIEIDVVSCISPHWNFVQTQSTHILACVLGIYCRGTAYLWHKIHLCLPLF